MTLPITCFRKHGRLIASSAPASSVNGCRPRHVSSPHDALHAILHVCVGVGRARRPRGLARCSIVDRREVMPGSRCFPPASERTRENQRRLLKLVHGVCHVPTRDACASWVKRTDHDVHDGRPQSGVAHIICWSIKGVQDRLDYGCLRGSPKPLRSYRH
jgi:hypothetical protein